MSTPRKVNLNDIFETEACSRCDGTGHYSYNLMHGSRCYGCNGRGWKFSKRGTAARDAWVATWTRTKPVEQVVAGERIAYFDSMHGRRYTFTVATSEPDTLNVGQNRWNLTFEQPAALGGVGYFIGYEVELPVSMDEKKAAYASIAHLPGATGWKEVAA